VWDQFVTGYEAWIHSAVTGAQSVIPGCDKSDECKTVVKMGVEAVWKYLTGLPADLPSSDQVFADSAAELIVESAIAVEKYYTGLDDSLIDNMCKEDLADCKKRISDAIKEEMKKAHSIAAQKTCIDAYQAYFHGREAVCLDPRIIVHEAPNSANLPASVMVRVTRQTSQESIWVPETDADKYKLMVWVDAASKDPNAPEPLSGSLYETALGPIPWLEPGESVDLPVALRLLGNEGSATRDLYFGETTASMKAVEACYSPDSSWDWVPCENGGQDTWVYDNPAGLGIEGVTP
jgi:hypothetical protein